MSDRYIILSSAVYNLLVDLADRRAINKKMSQYFAAAQKLASAPMEAFRAAKARWWDADHGVNLDVKTVPIVTMNANKPEVDLEALERILQKYKHRHVAIISVFGDYRGGKSFLLNLLCQYLTLEQANNWFKEYVKLVSVFHWKDGVERDTNGIHMTDKPFMLKNNNGQEIAVFLMDTQGSFDKDMTAGECSILFAFSTLLSSVQIYNFTGGMIRENDLQSLGVFLQNTQDNTGTATTSPSASISSLMLLVRNWERSGFDCGSIGGMKYWNSLLKTKPNENNEVRDKIKQSCVNVRCHLLPHPGKKVATGKCSEDRVMLGEIEEDFRKGVDDLAKCLFSENKLVVKQFNGEPCTGEDLLTLALQLDTKVRNNDIIQVRTIMKINEECAFHNKVMNFQKEYESSMESKMGNEYIKPELLEEYHKEPLETALRKFDEHDVLSENERLCCRSNLVKNLENAYNAMKMKNDKQKTTEMNVILNKANDAGEVFMEEMEKAASGEYLEDVNTAKAEAERKANEVFKTSTSDCNQELVKECENGLPAAIQSKYECFKETNQKLLEVVKENLKELTAECTNLYVHKVDQKINAALKRNNPLDLNMTHDVALKSALDKFVASKTGKGLQAKQIQRKSLIDEIKKRFKKYEKDKKRLQKAEEDRKLKQVKEERKLFDQRRQLESQYAKALQVFDRRYVGDDVLEETHKHEEQKALKAFCEVEFEELPGLQTEYKGNREKLKHFMKETFNKVKDEQTCKREVRFKEIQKRLDPFYELLKCDYFIVMKEVCQAGFGSELNKLHQAFVKAVELELKQVIPYKDIRKSAIATSLNTLGVGFKQVPNNDGLAIVYGGVMVALSSGSLVLGGLYTLWRLHKKSNILLNFETNFPNLTSSVFLKSVNFDISETWQYWRTV